MDVAVPSANRRGILNYSQFYFINFGEPYKKLVKIIASSANRRQLLDILPLKLYLL
jgi:hypothetical protein